jgi:hypothetical protein
LSKGKAETVKIEVPYKDALEAFLQTPAPHKKGKKKPKKKKSAK